MNKNERLFILIILLTALQNITNILKGLHLVRGRVVMGTSLKKVPGNTCGIGGNAVKALKKPSHKCKFKPTVNCTKNKSNGFERVPYPIDWSGTT